VRLVGYLKCFWFTLLQNHVSNMAVYIIENMQM